MVDAPVKGIDISFAMRLLITVATNMLQQVAQEHIQSVRPARDASSLKVAGLG